MMLRTLAIAAALCVSTTEGFAFSPSLSVCILLLSFLNCNTCHLIGFDFDTAAESEYMCLLRLFIPHQYLSLLFAPTLTHHCTDKSCFYDLTDRDKGTSLLFGKDGGTGQSKFICKRIHSHHLFIFCMRMCADDEIVATYSMWCLCKHCSMALQYLSLDRIRF